MLEFNVIFNGKTYGIRIFRIAEKDYVANCTNDDFSVKTVGNSLVSVLASIQPLIREKLGIKVWPDPFKR